MNTRVYALRAEARVDVDNLMDQLNLAGHGISNYVLRTTDSCDMLAQLETAATLDDLLAAIEKVPDGHIMYRTVQEATLETCEMDDYIRIER